MSLKMLWKVNVFSFLFVCCYISLTKCENILMVAPVAPKSHENILNSVAEILLERGHSVTMATPGSRQLSGAKYLNTSFITETLRAHFFKDESFKVFDGTSMLEKLKLLLNFVRSLDVSLVKVCLSDPNILKLYRLPPHTFDAIIVNEHANLCGYPLAYLQKAPLILLSPSAIFYRTHDVMGNPNLPSINPSLYMDFSDDMTFLERWLNSFSYFVPSFIFHHYTSSKIDAVIKAKTNLTLPSITSLMGETRLVLMNTHHVFTYPRALLPNMVEIGGIHCTPAGPLPADLEEFVSSNPNGFIYFSLGSTTPGHSLPEDKRNSFMEGFSRLKYNVIWKFDKPELVKEVPPNVKLVSWAPQQDLLGHSQIKLFITQCGLLSVQEATFHGAPILGVPLFGDQHSNINLVRSKGYGSELLWNEVSPETVYQSINTIAGDPSYKNNAKTYSKRFQDDITGPRFKTLYWIEYIMRNNGADFLMSAGRHLSFIRYYLLDIIAFNLFLTWMIMYLIYRSLKSIIRSMTSWKSPSGKQKKKTT